MINFHFKDLDFIHLMPGLLFLLFISVRLVLQKVGWWKRGHLGHSLLYYFSNKLTPASLWQIYLPGFLQALSLVFLYMAFLNPVIPISKHRLMIEGLNIVIVLDLSTSMLEYMESPQQSIVSGSSVGNIPQGQMDQGHQTRLDAVKTAAIDFIQRRPHDRIGLVVFSANAYVVNPMTTDHKNLIQYMNTLDANTLIGEGLTSIGEGISTALNLMEIQRRREYARETKGATIAEGIDRWMPKMKGQGKVIVVFTDADQNYGLDPFIPLQKARKWGYRIYFIGVAPSQDQALKNFWDELMWAIQSTGGRYFDAQDNQQLKQAYLHIDSLEKVLFYTEQYINNVPVYSSFIRIAFVLLALSLGLRGFRYFTRLA